MREKKKLYHSDIKGKKHSSENYVSTQPFRKAAYALSYIINGASMSLLRELGELGCCVM